MNDRLTLLDYLTFAVFAVQAAFAVHVGINGPAEATLPLHWNAALQVDRWGTGLEFAAVSGGLTLLGLLVCAGLGMGARRADAADDPARGKALRVGQGIALFVFAVLGLLTAVMTLGGLPPEGAEVLSMAAVSLIFAGLGAFLGRVAPNPLIGVRTPWTFKSRRAWDRANRLAGRLYFLLGLAGLVAAPLAPQPAGTFALVAGALAAAAWAVFESWRVWRADPDRQPF